MFWYLPFPGFLFSDFLLADCLFLLLSAPAAPATIIKLRIFCDHAAPSLRHDPGISDSFSPSSLFYRQFGSVRARGRLNHYICRVGVLERLFIPLEMNQKISIRTCKKQLGFPKNLVTLGTVGGTSRSDSGIR